MLVVILYRVMCVHAHTPYTPYVMYIPGIDSHGPHEANKSLLCQFN